MENRNRIVELVQTFAVDMEYMVIALAKFLSEPECEEFLKLNGLDSATMDEENEEDL